MTPASLPYQHAYLVGRGLAVALLLALASPAQAQPAPYAQANSNINKRGKPCHSLSGCDRRDYDDSGTRGRMGLGADPAHPEGPGNMPN